MLSPFTEGDTMPTKLKIALKLLLGSFAAFLNTIITDLAMAAILAFLSALFFVLGIGDLLAKMRFYHEGAMPASNQSVQYEKSTKTTILVTAGLIFAIIAMLIHGVFHYRAKFMNVIDQMRYVEEYQLHLPNYIVLATANGSLLKEHYEQEKAMIVCRFPDARIDAMDDGNIDKSQPHDVVNGRITVQLDISQTIVKRVKPGRYGIQCFLTLLPNGKSADNIKSLRQLKDLGGRILDNFSPVLTKV
jgi:hypothetical protein